MYATCLLAVFSAFMDCTYGTNRLACMLLIIRLSFVSPNYRHFITIMLFFQSTTPYTSRMSTAKCYSAIPLGFTGRSITVECDSLHGLPAFNIVGLPGRSIDESRLRIRSAIKNSGFRFPTDKITVNLAPADLRKTGTGFDLPIAVDILVSSGQLLQRDLEQRAFIGELSLNGGIKATHGIINAIEALSSKMLREIYIPADNAAEAALIADQHTIIPVQSLRQL